MEDLIGRGMDEEWRAIRVEGVIEGYEVSSEGQVRFGDQVMKQTPCTVRVKNKVYRYDAVSLRKNCAGVEYAKLKVHRLVAEAFVPNPEGKKEVVRVDESNRAVNLNWATRSEVTKAAVRKNIRGEKHHRYGVKVSEETRKLMAKAKTGARNPNVKGEYVCEGKIFKTATLAAKHFNVTVKTVMRRINSDGREWAAWYMKGQMHKSK